MKHIAFIIPSLAIGGSERVVTVLSNYLSKKDNIQIHIILLDENIIEYEVKSNIIINYISFNKKMKNPFKTIYRIKKIRSYLKVNKIETVISFLTSANILTILSTFCLNKRIIVSERSDPSRNCPSKKIEIFRNLLYHFCNIIVCQTEDAKRYFSKSLQSKIKVIINPVKCDLPQKNDAVFDHFIVTAARLQKSKNLALLLNSFYEVVNK